MSSQDMWLIALAISAPVSGIVGFAIQLRSVKKLRLENQKLSLEIQYLEKNIAKSDARIVIPTNAEVKRINRYQTLDAAPSSGTQKKIKSVLPLHLSIADILIGLGLIYLVYHLAIDVYHFVLWVTRL